MLLKKTLSPLKHWCWFALGRFARQSERPVIVLGNQKSGTTAIAALLARYGHLSATLDLRYLTPDELLAIQQGSLPFQAFVDRYGLDFSRSLIKEPHLTSFYPALAKTFPAARFVMVVRDPRDNIRSILNRLKIPGHLETLDPACLKPFNPNWKLVIDGRWLGLDEPTYIAMLASRWNHMAHVYTKQPGAFHLVRFEDFLADKAGTIAHLADRCGIPKRRDITAALNVPFQPRGNRHIPWVDFFGTTNLQCIEERCGPLMLSFNYTP